MGTSADQASEHWTSELRAVVAGLVTVRSSIAALHAQETELFARAVELAGERDRTRPRGGESDLGVREVSAELGTAMRISDRSVQRRLGEAFVITSRFPKTLEALQEGRIDHGHATAIMQAGFCLTDDAARAEYEQRALVVARTESVPRTRAALRSIAAEVEPAAAAEQTTRAMRDRRVQVFPLEDGMAQLLAVLPATLAYAVKDRLTELAHHVRADSSAASAMPNVSGPDAAAPETTAAETTVPEAAATAPGVSEDDPEPDQRGMDELRADIFTDLLLSGSPLAHGDGLAAIRARVQLTVPALSVIGAGTSPALLVGYGPVDTRTARRLTASAPGWDRVFTDPRSGLPVSVDRYRPTEQQRRYLRIRDEHCRFPGCRMAPWHCDIDHTTDAALGGSTSRDNLAHLCRRHHTLKHATAWSVTQRPGGVLEWTSPTGRKYPDLPAPTVRFVPEPTASSMRRTLTDAPF